MIIQPYGRHFFGDLKYMLSAQNSNLLHDLTHETLPEIGFVATDLQQVIAMGFLRRVEGGYAQIDTLATNPKVDSVDRHIAILQIYSELLRAAKGLGVPGLLIITESDSVIKRAEETGFKIIKQTLLGLPLEK